MSNACCGVPSGNPRTNLPPFAAELLLIYFSSFLFFFRLAVQIIPLVQKINYVKNGDVDEISSASSFTYFTIVFISNITELLLIKYVGSLSDFVGRKPVLLAAAIVFAIAHFMIAASDQDAIFYLAAFVGNTFQSQAPLTAWVCDLVEDDGRGKALGFLLGASIGLSFMFGLPLGIGLSSAFSPSVALAASGFISLAGGVVVMLIPVCDTKSSLVKMNSGRSSAIDQSASNPLHMDKEHQIVRATSSLSESCKQERSSMEHNVHKQEDEPSSNSWCYRTFVQDRSFPPSWTEFLCTQHFLTGFGLIRKAKSPLAFASYFWSFTGQQLINTVFLNFAGEVYGWGTAAGGIVTAIIAVSIAFFAPYMSGLYYELQLYGVGGLLAGLGNLFLAISGTDTPIENKLIWGMLGLFLLSFSGFYFPSIQTIITAQYPEDQQGEVLGVAGVLGQLTNIISYPTALLFSYTISSKSPVYWPGVVFFLACVYHLIGVACHVRDHGVNGLRLKRRRKTVLANDASM